MTTFADHKEHYYNMEKKFISLTYDLMLKDGEGKLYKYESATRERPFQFITGIGYALDLFEQNVSALNAGDSFEFEIPCDEAYGPYEQDNVIELDKGIFLRDGKFDDQHVKVGAVIPLSDGERTFNAVVTDIREDKVKVDLNHPLAGEDLTFKGKIIESRPATDEEVESVLHPKCHGCGGHCGQGDCSCEGDCGSCDK